MKLDPYRKTVGTPDPEVLTDEEIDEELDRLIAAGADLSFIFEADDDEGEGISKHLPGKHDQRKHGRKGALKFKIGGVQQSLFDMLPAPEDENIDTDLYWDSSSARWLTPEQRTQAEDAYDKFRAIFPEVAEKNWIKAIWVDEGIWESLGGTLAYVEPYWPYPPVESDYATEFGRRVFTSGVGVNLTLTPKVLNPLPPLPSDGNIIQATVGHDLENPLGATVFHELAHALWFKKFGVGNRTSVHQKRLEKAIKADPPWMPFPSQYASRNYAEFFAEVVTAAYFHDDKYPSKNVKTWRQWIDKELKRLDKERVAAGIEKAMDDVPPKTQHPVPWAIYDDFGYGEEIGKHGNKGEPGYFLLHPGKAPKGWKPTAEDWAAYNKKTTLKGKGKFKLDPDFYAPEPDYEDFGPVSPQQMKSLDAISDPQKYLTTSMDLLLEHQQPDDPSIKPVPPLLHTWTTGDQTAPDLDLIKEYVESNGFHGDVVNDPQLEAKKVGPSWVIYLYGEKGKSTDEWPSLTDAGTLGGNDLLDGVFFHRFTKDQVEDFDESTGGSSSVYVPERLKALTKAKVGMQLRKRMKENPRWMDFQIAEDDRAYNTRSENWLIPSDRLERMEEGELIDYRNQLRDTWNQAVGIDSDASEKMYIKRQRENLIEMQGRLPAVLDDLQKKYPFIYDNFQPSFVNLRELMKEDFSKKNDTEIADDAMDVSNFTASLQRAVNMVAHDGYDDGKKMPAMDHFVFSNALKTSQFERDMLWDTRVAFDPFPGHLSIHELEREVKLADLTRKYIDQWAESAGDHKPMSIAVQRIASEWSEARFEHRAGELASLKATASEEQFYSYTMTDSDNPPWVRAEDHMKKDRDFLWMFLDAQYDETQAYFQEQGIKQVRLHRGMYFDEKPSWFGDEQVRRNIPVKMNPLSSWSANFDTAKGFASDGRFQVIFSDAVPVESIFATSVTGIGALNETEVVVLGYEEIDFVQWKTSGY